jgi:hypothetical protein
MGTKTINKLISNEKFYFGTFARNLLPKRKLESHGSLNVNTDPVNKED